MKKKNAPIWEEDFAFHIFNIAQNKKAKQEIKTQQRI